MISQVNITVDDSKDTVPGYNNINIDQLSSVTNGYIQSIIFTTIDKLDNNNRSKKFVESLKKLAHGGQLTVRFLNLALLASRIESNYIDGLKFAELIRGLNSFWTESDFLGIISSINEYKLTKIVNEDLYIIAVIEKNK
jgi:hypothetical protein